jgi:hypothetical protein
MTHPILVRMRHCHPKPEEDLRCDCLREAEGFDCVVIALAIYSVVYRFEIQKIPGVPMESKHNPWFIRDTPDQSLE